MLQQPYCRNSMITTSSRLQYLDSHFSTSFASPVSPRRTHGTCTPFGKRQKLSHPHHDKTPRAEALSRSSSKTSLAESFHTAILFMHDEAGVSEDGKTMNTPTRPSIDMSSSEDGAADQSIESNGWRREDLQTSRTKEEVWIPATSKHSGSSFRARAQLACSHYRRPSDVSEPLPPSSIPQRTSSRAQLSKRKSRDLVNFHQNSCRLFQSLDGTLADKSPTSSPPASRPQSMPVSRAMSFSQPHLDEKPQVRSVTLPSYAFEYPQPDCRESDNSPDTFALGESAATFSKPRPVTAMSWISESSRRTEYAKIDRAHRGVRGLLKRVVPKWCQNPNGRRKFFEGADDDGESVRRYRMPLSEGSDDGDSIMED